MKKILTGKQKQLQRSEKQSSYFLTFKYVCYET